MCWSTNIATLLLVLYHEHNPQLYNNAHASLFTEASSVNTTTQEATSVPRHRRAAESILVPHNGALCSCKEGRHDMNRFGENFRTHHSIQKAKSEEYLYL